MTTTANPEPTAPEHVHVFEWEEEGFNHEYRLTGVSCTGRGCGASLTLDDILNIVNDSFTHCRSCCYLNAPCSLHDGHAERERFRKENTDGK